MSNMKALRFHPPRGFEKLRYESEPKPAKPKEGQVLIKVHSVGLIYPEVFWPIYQDSEGHYHSHIPGHGFSGIIEEVGGGQNSSNLKPGSEAYAFTSRRNHEGAMAEYALADIDQVLPKPRNLSLREAGSVPLSALTAWQALFEHGKLQAGQKLLITGAAGGTGIYAIQFAKMTGAHVIGTGSSPRSRQIAEDLGIDEFIDYKMTVLGSAVHDVDLVLDCVGGSAFEQSCKTLKPHGLVISINVFDCEEQARKLGARGIFFIVSMNAGQLSQITKLFEEGKLRPMVDNFAKLEDGRRAFEEAAQGHVHGKVVVEVAG